MLIRPDFWLALFDLKENLFYCKEQQGVVFPERKRIGRNRPREENGFAMESETIVEGLKKYGIGGKLRRLRLRKSMGLLQLSKHTGLSPALLSKLERDLMHPTLPTLLRIALVFSVGLDFFFTPEPKPVLEIVRKKDRMRFPDSPDAGKVAYYFESLDFPVPQRALNSYLAEFECIEIKDNRFHKHPGIEFLYVISGHLELHTRSLTA
jgi:transcriptional regulator with XRE-family HTH domain